MDVFFCVHRGTEPGKINGKNTYLSLALPNSLIEWPQKIILIPLCFSIVIYKADDIHLSKANAHRGSGTQLVKSRSNMTVS